jgi:hypothetical protein
MEVTQDHDEIRRRAEARDGRPQVFDNPRAGSDPVGLRINFPGPRDDTFLPGGSNAPREVSWEEFFAHFDRLDLVMEYEPEPSSFEDDPSARYRFRRLESI